MASIQTRIKRAWNAFTNQDNFNQSFMQATSYNKPDRLRLSIANERSQINAIFCRMANDVAAIDFRHVLLDEQDRYVEDVDSSLNRCLSLEANIDQTGRDLFRDAALTMFDSGVVALVPVQTNITPIDGKEFDIKSIRCGTITQWFPRHVRVKLYNDEKGSFEEIMLPKRIVAIVENPFYTVMNEPNSTLKRLTRKLSLLDAVDEQSSSGKLDLIIQLPYTVKTPTKQRQAEMRKQDIENQLTGSRYGIAYIDSTEHITQLNRSVDNNLMKQIEYLDTLMHSQLGITAGIMDGSANESTMTNYYNRTIEPIVTALCEGMKRKWLTQDQIYSGESIVYVRDPFKLIPVSQIADIGDKMTRNEIMSSNEIRSKIGLKPSDQPGADELRNKNLNQSKEALAADQGKQESESSE